MKNKMLVVLIGIICSLSASLDRQYLEAYDFARNPNGLHYTHGQAFLWAKNFVETKGVFRSRSLVTQYQEAFEFAIRFLEMPTNEADLWAKTRVLEYGSIPLRANISNQVNAFLDRVVFNEEQGKNWLESFFSSSEPLFTNLDMIDLYREIYFFCRRNSFIAADHSGAVVIANKFIQNRFRFYSSKSLIEQYVVAFEFAFDSEGLHFNFEDAIKWAQSYIATRGVVDSDLGLGEQYREAFLFARSSGGLRLSDEESVNWARNFIAVHAEFSKQQSLLEKYQEAFLFAYNGEVLELLTKMRDAPRGVFLADEAQKYAQKLVQSRTEINPLRNLLTQYRNAFLFAHSSDGLRLEYYKAKNWAKKFMEYKIQK
ncbi:hypothetical protein [Candidatus Uabimicrobium sp. HlEnr_7]|uniref:hypothetical protein n=1 Tax=Candidatus Uabimicrobium helgolandensis TaxID=3095367 RepID=UPI003557B37A